MLVHFGHVTVCLLEAMAMAALQSSMNQLSWCGSLGFSVVTGDKLPAAFHLLLQALPAQHVCSLAETVTSAPDPPCSVTRPGLV